MTLRRTLILVGLAALFLVPVPAQAVTGGTRATIFIIHDTSYEELLAIPGVSHIATAGGKALLVNADELLAQARDLAEAPPAGQQGEPDIRLIDLGTPPTGASDRATFLENAGTQIVQTVAENENDGLVVIGSVGESPDMRETGDQLNGVVVADAYFLDHQFGPTALTSSSTRRSGVVAGTDLRPTVARFFRSPGEDWRGSIQDVGSGSTVADIHERYLSVRRMYVPVAIVAGTTVLFILVFALLVYYRRASSPGWVLYLGKWAAFATPALAVALLAAGHLPDLSYLSVGSLAAVVTIVLPLAALAWARRGTLVPPRALGLMVLAFFLVESATGWYGTMFTLMGGTALDGGRFYGLPNAFEGLLVGSAVYVAADLKPWKGYAAILAVALFVGLPGLGADIGGAVAALAAAGLWLALSTRERFGMKEASVVAATVVVGLAVVLVAHRFFASSPTHGTAFVEATGSDPLHALSTLRDRLGIGVSLLRRNPFGLIYLAATPVLIWVVVKRRAGLRGSFDAFPRWRSAILTILLASVVAYFVNDTGVSAVGMGFAMALGGLLYVPLAQEVVNMDAT